MILFIIAIILKTIVRYKHEISRIKDAKPNQDVHFVCEFVITVIVITTFDCSSKIRNFGLCGPNESVCGPHLTRGGYVVHTCLRSIVSMMCTFLLHFIRYKLARKYFLICRYYGGRPRNFK